MGSHYSRRAADERSQTTVPQNRSSLPSFHAHALSNNQAPSSRFSNGVLKQRLRRKNAVHINCIDLTLVVLELREPQYRACTMPRDKVLAVCSVPPRRKSQSSVFGIRAYSWIKGKKHTFNFDFFVYKFRAIRLHFLAILDVCRGFKFHRFAQSQRALKRQLLKVKSLGQN